MINMDSITKISRDGTEAAMKSLGAMSTGVQAVASENVDFMKRSFEEGQKVAEKLLGVKTLQDAIQIQSDYVRSSYEGLVAQSSKLNQMNVNTAKEAAAPFQGLIKTAA